MPELRRAAFPCGEDAQQARPLEPVAEAVVNHMHVAPAAVDGGGGVVDGPVGEDEAAKLEEGNDGPPSASASRRHELWNARAFLGASSGRAGTQPPGTSSTAGGAQMHDAAAGRRALLVCHWTVKDVILAVVLVWSV